MKRLALLAALPLLLAAADPDGRLSARPPETPAALGVPAGQPVKLYRGIELYVPADARPDERFPLLVLLPGTNGSGAAMVETLKGVADLHRFALLGVSPAHANFAAVDRFFDDREANRPEAWTDWPHPRFGSDLDRLDAGLARAFARAPIDPGHVGLLGFSHGGSYALMVGTANPDLFTTVAALSPGLLVIPERQPGGQRVFLAHGRRDQSQPYARTACAMPPRLRALGHQVSFEGFDGEHDIPNDVLAHALSHFLAGREGPAPAFAAPDCD